MVRVLVVDDSSAVRKVLTRGLSMDPDIEVVGAAADPYEARDKIVELRPDVMTLDLAMPRMDGVVFLRRLMAQFPVPTVVVSGSATPGSPTAATVLAAGAVAVVAKGGVDEMLRELREAVKRAAPSSPTRATRPAPAGGPTAIVVGASTGGPRAVVRLLEGFPADSPPVLVTVHMPELFTGSFAKRIGRFSRLEGKEAVHGDTLVSGQVLVAPGGQHMRVVRRGAGHVVELDSGPLVGGHRPSVDVLMQSAASALGPRGLGVLLTGMGRDGAKGLLAMRQAGAPTWAQDEGSSVVFGMPKAAIELGAACEVLPLHDMSAAVVSTWAPQTI